APVAGLVGHDSQEPGTEGCLPAEAAEGVPGLDEGVLHHLGRVTGRAEHGGQAAGRVLVQAEEGGVGIHVTLLCPSYELAVVVWSAQAGRLVRRGARVA